jgi:uncharacterized protein YoxC
MSTATKSGSKQIPENGVTADVHLIECIQKEAVVFDLAVKLLEQLEVAAERRTLGTAQHVHDLEKILEDVVRAQQNVSQSRSLFTASGLKASAELQSVIRQHEDTLQKLVTRINVMKSLFEEVKSALGYKMDSGTKHRNMQAAYGKVIKTT